MKNFLLYFFLSSFVFAYTLEAQKNNVHQNNWTSVSYDIGTNIPYLKEAILASTIAYSASSCLCDSIGINIFGSNTHSHKKDSLSSLNTFQANDQNYQSIDRFAKFRTDTIRNNPFIPGGDTNNTVYENFELYQNSEYRVYLKTFPEYKQGMTTLAEKLKQNKNLIFQAQKIQIYPCKKCLSRGKSPQSLVNWIFNEAQIIESKQKTEAYLNPIHVSEKGFIGLTKENMAIQFWLQKSDNGNIFINSPYPKWK